MPGVILRASVCNRARLLPAQLSRNPTATFVGPGSTLAVPPLALSHSDESKTPQLPTAAAPSEASSHHTADGGGFPQSQNLTALRHLGRRKGIERKYKQSMLGYELLCPPHCRHVTGSSLFPPPPRRGARSYYVPNPGSGRLRG